MSLLESVINIDSADQFDSLSEKDFNITSSSGDTLARKLKNGQLTSEEILEAFIKRSMVDGACSRASYLTSVRYSKQDSNRLSMPQLKLLSQLYHRDESNSRIPQNKY